MNEKIVIHPQVGKITIIRGASNRTIRLSVHPSKGIRLSMPLSLPLRSAEKFIEERVPWIVKTQKKTESRAELYKIDTSGGTVMKIIGGTICFTAALNLNKISVIRRGTNISILHGHEHPRKTLLEALEKVLRIVAKSYLPERVAILAKQYGFEYNRIFLKNNRSNWGSCSSKANINLNIHLMRLPQELCDHIILHELCHLKYRNHGPEFHKLLDKLNGGREKEMSKAMRNYRPYLI